VRRQTWLVAEAMLE